MHSKTIKRKVEVTKKHSALPNIRILDILYVSSCEFEVHSTIYEV